MRLLNNFINPPASQTEDDIPGLRKMLFITFGLSIAVGIFSNKNLMEDQIYWRIYFNTVNQIMLLLLIIFYYRLKASQRLILLTIIINFASAVAFYQNGLISVIKFGLFIAPVFISLVVNIRVAMMMLGLNGLIYLAIMVASITGKIPMPNLELLSVRPTIMFNSLVLGAFSISFLLLLSGMKNQLVDNVNNLQIQNDQLIQEEKTLSALQNDLQFKVSKRSDELKIRENELLQTRNLLIDQIETIRQQNQVLEETLLEIKTTQANLIQSRKLTSLGSLTTGIAHELNNPLNFIQGAISILEQSPSVQSDEETQKIIGILKSGNEKIKTIVKSLGQFNPKETNETTTCDLPAIVRDAQLMVKHLFNDSKVFSLEQPGFNCVVQGHSDKLHQLFLNLIHNAAQAVDEKGTVKASFSLDEKTQSITTHVKDSGSGIPPELLDKIMEPFFTTKPAGSGTGLGLYISKQIVETHQGTIRFLSTPGKGTEVQVTLPINISPQG